MAVGTVGGSTRVHPTVRACRKLLGGFAESADKLAEFAREEGSAMLRRMNRRALELQRADAGEEQATHRMTFGSYFYAADELDEPDSGLGAAKDKNDED